MIDIKISHWDEIEWIQDFLDLIHRRIHDLTLTKVMIVWKHQIYVLKEIKHFIEPVNYFDDINVSLPICWFQEN